MFRKSSRQATASYLEFHKLKTDYDAIYKTAFKEATKLVADAVAEAITTEPVQGVCDRLNAKYELKKDRAKKHKELTRTTVYQYVKDGLAGKAQIREGLHQSFLMHC